MNIVNPNPITKGKEDPLDALFVKGDEVNRALLGTILARYVRLDEKGRIFPLSAFYAEPNKNKIIIVLLSRKAIAIKTGLEEEISPSELNKLVDMPSGSFRPTLRMLAEEKIADDENSMYKIFSHAVQRCAELLAPKPTKTHILEFEKKEKGRPLKLSMRASIEDIMRQGELDSGKTAKEIHDRVVQRRPGTSYNALYKVILDLINEQKIARDLKEGAWVYRRANK